MSGAGTGSAFQAFSRGSASCKGGQYPAKTENDEECKCQFYGLQEMGIMFRRDLNLSDVNRENQNCHSHAQYVSNRPHRSNRA